MSDLLDYAVMHARNGVILDTNVLLVLTVGLWNSKAISEYKRTSSYSADDFVLLSSIVERVGKIVTTPHILTEVCNLTDSLNRQHGCQIYQTLALLQQDARERRQEAVRLMTDPLFLTFGLADTSLIDASKKRHLVITDEAACYAAIVSSGGLAINLNHLRGAAWLNTP